MSPRDLERSPRGGFLLMEALVALVVGGLFLGVLGRAFATAWGSARTPRETVSAMVVARAVATGTIGEAGADEGWLDGYQYRRRSSALVITELPSRLAPPLLNPGTPQVPKTAPVSATQGPSDPTPVATPMVVSVVVRTPSNKRFSLESVVLGTPQH